MLTPAQIQLLTQILTQLQAQVQAQQEAQQTRRVGILDRIKAIFARTKPKPKPPVSPVTPSPEPVSEPESSAPQVYYDQFGSVIEKPKNGDRIYDANGTLLGTLSITEDALPTTEGEIPPGWDKNSWEWANSDAGKGIYYDQWGAVIPPAEQKNGTRLYDKDGNFVGTLKFFEEAPQGLAGYRESF